MPNQDKSTQNQNPVSLSADPPVDQATTPPVAPVLFPQSDLPPLSPEFQNLSKNDAPAVPPGNSDSGSATPPDISSVIPKAKKKFGGGKIIATILVLAVIIGGLGAGVLLTQQQQLFKQKAIGACGDDCTTIGETKCVTGQTQSWITICSVPLAGCSNNYWKIDHYVDSCSSPPTSPPNPEKCSNPGGGNPDGCYNQYPGYEYCSVTNFGNGGLNHMRCDRTGASGLCTNTYIDPCDNPCLDRPSTPSYVKPPECSGGTPTPTVTPTSSPTLSPTATASPTESPTASPIAPSCIAVKAYDDGWTVLTNVQLSALTAGDIVNFCVNGSATSGTFDKAQFKINSILEPETTNKRPSTDDFCQSYTILSTDTTVSVKAKIHHTTLGWFGEEI